MGVLGTPVVNLVHFNLLALQLAKCRGNGSLMCGSTRLGYVITDSALVLLVPE